MDHRVPGLLIWGMDSALDKTLLDQQFERLDLTGIVKNEGVNGLRCSLKDGVFHGRLL